MKISSRAHGEGPVLVFLHGYAGSVLHWDSVVEDLKKQFTCVVVNYSHFYMGRTALSFADQAKLLADWIEEKFPLQKVHLIGMSYGAALSWAIGITHPHLVDRVVFVNPMPPAPARHFAMAGMKIFFRLPLGRKVVLAFLSTYFGRNFLKKCAHIFRLQTRRETKRLDNLEGKKKLFVVHLFNNFAWILKNENWKRWQESLRKDWKHQSMIIFDDKDPLFEKPCYSDFVDLLRCQEKVITSGAGHIATQNLPHLISQAVANFLLRQNKKEAA